ncbi:MAG: hypothetical protein PHO15_10085 [Eubacteriales bacterium]|nr:hypothetical protein [Eubacteriales bacterium]
MNKAGYIFSIIGGVLAILFSVMLIVTGPILFAEDDIDEFVSENADNLGAMWTYLGDYNGVDAFLENDFSDYMSGYIEVLQNVDADELKDIGEKYDVKAFDDLADIYADAEAYLPMLKIGVIACLIASVIALIGAEIARNYRIAGGAMVLSGAALTLIFSLVAASIVPMALASLLLIVGGIFQIIKPKAAKAIENKEVAS